MSLLPLDWRHPFASVGVRGDRLPAIVRAARLITKREMIRIPDGRLDESR